MRKIFSIESRYFRIFSRITDVFILNLLFILTSLPLVTIGASMAALNGSWQRILRGEENEIIKYYFHYFKSNFRQSTIIWVGLLTTAWLILVELIFFLNQIGPIRWVGLTALIVISIMWFIIVLVSLTYICLYEDRIVRAIKNSFLLIVKKPFYSLVLIWINILVVYFSISNIVGLFTALYVFTFGGISALAGLNAWLTKHILSITK
ncbi:YesL family protein [Streptococcus suis]|nr:YesL family protein [Streptococcus suis]MBY5038529.1 YesL family protein [Streptococcus suis]